ncbi:MAG: RIP metalloprotease RseP [Verrucomicrobia bacterium]|nr:RIP metalloprotease RseP [Verrucomicrobiota bacterium]
MLLAIYTIIVLLLLFGVTVFIHELGHFLSARLLGLQADAFSIGFGHAIWKKKIRGVLYKIGWIPCGGYVALPQMDPTGTEDKDEDGNSRNLPHVAPWRKIIVAFAGPVGNVVLAFIIAWVIYWVGKPASPDEASSVVGFVETNSVAYAAGLRPGDEIRSVNGEKITNWQDFLIVGALSDEVEMVAARGDETFTVSLATEKLFASVRGVGGMVPVGFCKVLATMPGSSAEEAGVLAGDLITTFNGEPVYSIPHLIKLVNDVPGQRVPMTVQRGGETLTLEVSPAYDAEAERALIGVQFNQFYVDTDQRVHPRPLDQIRGHAAPIFRILKAFVTPGEAKHAAQGIGGPVAIFYSLWLLIQSSFMMALWFTCFLNINLAILNLLPLPVLDGGHIVFSLWELITRRPVHKKLVVVLWNVFFVLLFGLMIFLAYRDVMTIFFSRSSSAGAADTSVTNAPAGVQP